MKKLTQLTKSILLVLISAAILFTSLNTSAVASSIQLGGAETVPGYVAGVKFTTKTKTDGTLLYCLNMNKKTAKYITANLAGEKDAGVAYIVTNGYPNKSFTGDRLKDYYITQTALWWYLDNTAGGTNLSEKFKVTGSDEHNLRPTIKNLVAKAEEAKKAGYAKTSLALTASNFGMKLDGNYYVSEEIYAKSYSNISTYTVSATGANNIQVVDANGKAKTSFGVKEKFRVKVPVSSVSGTSLTINIAASATGVVYKAYEYKPTDSSMQPVTVSIPEKETVNVTAKLALEIESSKVSIVKVDKLTQNSIAGATLVVKDANGTVKAKWVSTTNYHVIRNLPNGTYTVEETKAPAGYLLNSNPVKFTITNTNRDIKIKFENTPRETVVNIIKIDASTGNPLAGAVLLVKDSAGSTVAQFTSTTEPYVLTDLDNGTYTVEEVSAPAGYKHSTEIKTFTITDENLSHQITFENHPEVPVPDTASSSLIMTLLGIVIIGAGISFVYKNGKKAR
ncbi:MAG: Cys-Gln thioester bond-forming surface protein [Bacilli bacterium]|nr:Cys-Gln thioester bond-forming surface protein [Bacilli bacterium]